MAIVEIPKTELIPILTAYYSEALRESAAVMYLLEQKHGCGFNEFETRAKEGGEEVFEVWDDYMEWKGHLKSASYLYDKINKIKNGFFTLA